MNIEQYERAEMEVIEFETADVITASVTGFGFEEEYYNIKQFLINGIN